METAPLKSFASWARTALIREVAARISAVLAPGSSEVVEQARAVAALEQAVAAAGGGDKGRVAVADKVAYIWFNRIIALRFMDANGYTGIGIVSPQAGVTVGQPEILADAKRGVIDSEAVSEHTRMAVVGLLDGARTSVDAQGEAYALLLADYCRHWNRAMPFMFEREGDFTELLIPANLLADDSVLNRSVEVLTADVCEDVEVIGWLYQFYISERKDEVFAGFKKNKKAGAAEIPAATQLFTPHWIVRYLVENSLGRLWMLNRPSSGLVEQMDYYIAPVEEETDFLKITKPEELKIIDPACGSGHMLTYAFDLLYAIYEEEGYAPAEIPGLILTHNLYGTEIDPRAGALAAFALTMKARAKQRTFFNNQFEPNVCVIEPISFSPAEIGLLMADIGDRRDEEAFWSQFTHADIYGALIRPGPDLTAQLAFHLETLDDDGDMLKADTVKRARRVVRQAEYLIPRYHVLIANPPYMGSKNMSAQLSERLTLSFPSAKTDLFAAFIARSVELLVGTGHAAMMTPNVWLYLSSHKGLRVNVVLPRLETLVELPLGGFTGATVQICAFTMSSGGRKERPADFVRLVGLPGGESEMAKYALDAIANGSSPNRYRALTTRFAVVDGSPAVYWLSDAFFSAFDRGTPLREVAEPRQGMATADNARFVRHWWEVSARRCSFDSSTRSEAKNSGARWFPYTDGGDFRRWYGNCQSLVNWENDGQELRAFSRSVIRNPDLYFRESVAWSAIGSGVPAFRHMPIGSLFSNAGMAFFADHDTLKRLAAVCNSATGGALFAAVAPTLNLGVGEIAKLPILDIPEEVEAIVDKLIERAKFDWDDFETSWEFQRPSLLPESSADWLLRGLVRTWAQSWREASNTQRALEVENNRIVSAAYGLTDEIALDVPQHRVSLKRNLEFIFGPDRSENTYADLQRASVAEELVSYAVGCMFGRYSIDEPGLILADQAATLQDYLAKVSVPSFMPDADNVIPIVDGDWFEDDIVARFRRFLRVAFGEEHFEENLRFVTESLGVKDLRDYFVKSFYKDHVQRYKKRPIYWLFSSSKGSFNALIYMHRYTPSTVSAVLNEYLREFQAKVKASLEHAERSNNAKEADRLRKVILELDDYEHDVLYPLASQNIAIDLDDGVKMNYPKFGDALKKIPGLEGSE